ncbi:hypothetical protein VQ03_27330 [Methylobacterium tarhaniae]|uniref:Uncharacterized protein n=1 Tax=Methylobacterium tarhaniae TaxID=1187852 RepID=A0A0J6SD74_9HYPH|nr:hypothetical protein VQ03_27330 [Methylobacterium tarhaniae]
MTAHALHPSFVLIACDLGDSGTTVGAILGHASRMIASGYVHHLGAMLVATADQVAGRVAETMIVEIPAASTPEGEELKAFATLVRAMATRPKGAGLSTSGYRASHSI